MNSSRTDKLFILLFAYALFALLCIGIFGCASEQSLFYSAIDCLPLSNGDILVLFSKLPEQKNFADALIRFSSKGEKIWELRDGLRFAHTINSDGKGNFLISNTLAKEILTVSPFGKVIDRIKLKAAVNDAEALPDGALLVSAMPNRILTLARNGRILKEIRYPSHASKEVYLHDVEPLPDGGVRVCISREGKVVWLDKRGKLVNEITGYRFPKNVTDLPGGELLISDAAGVHRLDAAFHETDFIPFQNAYNTRFVSGKLYLSSGKLVICSLSGQVEQTLGYRWPGYEAVKSAVPEKLRDKLQSLGYLH